MIYKGFNITYDYKNINCVYRVDTGYSIHYFNNLYWALQFTKTCSEQLNH